MYIQNTNQFRGYKLTFADWFKFRLIEELTYEMDVWSQEKFLTNDAQYLIFKSLFGLNFWLGHCFKAHFHIYYLFVGKMVYSSL
jgi:hypothetical protein